MIEVMWGVSFTSFFLSPQALAPVYCYAAWFTWRRLGEAQSQLWILIWLVAAALTLVPAHLIEPRYLTTAVVVAHAHAPERAWSATVTTMIGCMLVNAATIHIFLYRPFTGVEGGQERWMW